MSRQHTILYIDDDAGSVATFRNRLPTKVRIVNAPSIRAAMQKYQRTPGLTMIVIAGGGDERALTLLTTIIRPRFRGPMIAGHDDPAINRALMAAGCNDRAEQKADVPTLIKRKLVDAAVSRDQQHDWRRDRV